MTYLLLPGWAMLGSIYTDLNLNEPSIVPETADWFLDPWPIASCLRQNGIRTISCVAFSMGATVLARWMTHLGCHIDHLHIIGARQRYPERDLTGIRRLIAKDRDAFLTQFYQSCFQSAPDRNRFNQFIAPKAKRAWDDSLLLAGLDVLSKPLDIDGLRRAHRITVYHGESDIIAPFNEAHALAESLSADLISLPNMGHCPLLSPDFNLCIT